MHPPSYWKASPTSRALRGLLWVLVLLLPTPMAAQGIDIRRATMEALDLLRVLVRQDTTNPPGNEVLAARPLAVFFSDKGIDCQMIEPEPGRGNLLCRVRGNGTALPLLIVAHLDTAPVDAIKWDPPPFSGKVQRGFVHGRGAAGGKAFVAAAAEAVGLLSRQESLNRDVIFLGAADGESSGEPGLKWLLEHRPELVEAEMVLTLDGPLLRAGEKRVSVGLGPEARLDAPLPRAIRGAAERLDPGSEIVADHGPGSATSRLLWEQGMSACGLFPFPLEKEEVRRLTDGENERLSLESFSLGLQMLYEVLLEVAAPAPGV